MNCPRPLLLAAAFALACPAAMAAKPATVEGFLGGWGYRITGTYTNTSELDLQDDLGLKSTARQDHALGFHPGRAGWLPAVRLDYARIAASGLQRVPLVPPSPLDPLIGVITPTETVVANRTSINDFELTTRWLVPRRWLPETLELQGGFTLAALRGSVQVADETNGQQQTQSVNEVFPLASAAVHWQPLSTLRLSLSGDYVRYQDNRADELEAMLRWQAFGPVGLEAGYRQRRYRFNEPMNALDSRVAGWRVGMVMAVPLGR